MSKIRVGNQDHIQDRVQDHPILDRGRGLDQDHTRGPRHIQGHHQDPDQGRDHILAPGTFIASTQTLK